MKKLSAILLIILLIMCCISPVMADTTTVKYNVTQTYTLSIPASGVDFGESATTTAQFGVQAGSLLEASKSLTIKITSDNYANSTYRMKNDSDANVFLNYRITYMSGDPLAATTVVPTESFITATAAECNEGKVVDLTFTREAPTQAGQYTDTLTFTASVQ